jgi:hypothetical protein
MSGDTLHHVIRWNVNFCAVHRVAKREAIMKEENERESSFYCTNVQIFRGKLTMPPQFIGAGIRSPGRVR